MGFFSYDCKACGHPALCPKATDVEINAWMTDCVVLAKNGDRVSGEYDGYGHVGNHDVTSDGNGDPCLYHRACWEVAGKPAYSGPSTHAGDQGWFYGDSDHDMLDPRVKHAPDALERAQAARDGRKRGLAFRYKDEDADEDTYAELYAMQCEEARPLNQAECIARWGYDPVAHERRIASAR